MQIRLCSNRVGGILSIVFGGLVMWLIPRQVEVSRIPGTYIGPRYTPHLLAILFIALGVILLLKSLKNTGKAIVTIDLRRESRVVGMFVLLILYAVLLQPLGFLITTSAFSGATLLFLGSRKWTNYLLMLGIIAGIYGLFGFVLQVDLP